MEKVKDKFLNLGLSKDQVSARTFLAGFSPENYIPALTDTEGLDKISAHLKGIDQKLGAIVSASFTDQLFVGDGVSTELLVTNTFSASQKMDVFFNGVLSVENEDWQRDATTNKIQYLNNDGDVDAFPNNAEIRVRIYNIGFDQTDEYVKGDGSITEFTMTNNFGSGDFLDVFFNGHLKEENVDWERESSTNKVKFLDDNGDPFAPPSGTNIQMRIWNVSHIDQHFDGGSASYTPSQTFDDSSKIDVYFNGDLKTEGDDWTRDSNANTIEIVGGASVTNSNTDILIRIWN